MKETRQTSAYPLRLPDELKVYLKHAAVDNRRTLHDELLARLEASRGPGQGVAPQTAQQQ